MAYTYEETLNLFLEEAREGLLDFETSLLSIEKAKESEKPELINRALRVVHSIKGSAGYFGFSAIDELAQVLEFVLGQARAGQLSLTSENIGTLLVGGDQLSVYVENSSSTEHIDTSSIVESIAAILNSENAEAPAKKNLPRKDPTKTSTATQGTKNTKTKSEKVTAPPSNKARVKKSAAKTKKLNVSMDKSEKETPPEILNLNCSVALSAKAHGEAIYAFYLLWDDTEDEDVICNRRNDLKSLGTIIDDPLKNWVRFSSVLDADLLAAALSIPESALITIPLTLHKSNGEQNTDYIDEKTPVGEEPKSVAIEGYLIEDEIAEVKSGEKKASTVRISIHLLDELVNLAGELVLSRNQIERAGQLLGADNENLLMVIQRLSAVTSQLREKIMETRMQRVDTVLMRLPRVVRDLSIKLSKEVRIEISGGEVELDRTILEAVSEPLVHMVRNAMDHGFETPETRLKAGKPQEGVLRIEASHAGDFVSMKFSDDGRGIDHRSILSHAINKGLVKKTEAAAMGVKDAFSLLMSPGFSTKDEVTSVSGLGVGLDVVKTQIERLGGSVAVNSKIGEGTTFTLRLPVTLAIVPAMFVKTGPYVFGVLLKQVQKLERIRYNQRRERIVSVNGVTAMKAEGQLVPLVRLADAIGINRTYIDPEKNVQKEDRRNAIADRRAESYQADETDNLNGKEPPSHLTGTENRQPVERRASQQETMQIVTLGHDENRFGIIVDSIMDNEEIVVKPCPKEFSFNPCYMGTTILGDGNLAAILDPEGIIRLAQLNFKNITSQEVKSVEKNSGFLDSVNSTNFLIFETGEGFRYGVPLSSVGKLERIHRSECQTRGGAELFQRDDRTLHLIKINQFINEVGTDPELEDVMYAIIPHGHEEHYAILATKIVDTIDVNSAARSYSSEGLGNIYLQARFALGDTLVLVPDVNAIIGALLKKGGKQ